jgi:Tol biopolymer transport system component
MLAYTDYVNADANLIVRDLTTGLDRQVTTDATAPGNEVLEKAFSRDGRFVAYSFDSWELRLVDLTKDRPAPRTLFKQEERYNYVRPFDWSADGSRIAIEASRGRESAQVGYVTVDDGTFHALRTINWQGSSRVSISPDGDYLAFDRRTDDNGLPDVFVISTDGRRETPVAQTPGRDAVVGWSADGAYLLLTTERDGLNGLWAQPMRDGRPSGRPELLQADVSPTPVGVTSSGDAYFSVDPSTEGIYIASGDLSSATFQVHGTRPIRGERPEWSPDGTAIAYADIGRTRVTVHRPLSTDHRSHGPSFSRAQSRRRSGSLVMASRAQRRPPTT